MATDRTRGNGHKLNHTKFHLNIRKSIIFYGECDPTLEKVAQGGYEVSITGDFHNLTRYNPEQYVIADPCSAGAGTADLGRCLQAQLL